MWVITWSILGSPQKKHIFVCWLWLVPIYSKKLSRMSFYSVGDAFGISPPHEDIMGQCHPNWNGGRLGIAKAGGSSCVFLDWIRKIQNRTWLACSCKDAAKSYWLVVYLPLWKVMELKSVGMMTFPTEWKVIKARLPRIPWNGRTQPSEKSLFGGKKIPLLLDRSMS